MESFLRMFDSYNRTARLYPALVTLSPVFIGMALTVPDLASTLIAPGSLCAVLMLGGTYLLATLARSRGKLCEEWLLKQWGGWPTTILLRHSDDTIDPETKSRYHRKLQVLTGRAIPTRVEEIYEAATSDHRYRAATTQLIEARRPRKYGLLHAENASYGFRRNLLGLKPIGIATSSLLMLFAVFLWQAAISSDVNLGMTTLLFDRVIPVKALAVFCVGAVFALLWLLAITPGFVRQAANDYSLALLRTLDDEDGRAVIIPPRSDGSLRPSGGGA